MVSISFTTTHSAASALVPSGLDVIGDEPIVTISRMSYADTDYLAGGGYNEVTVGISAQGLDGGRAVIGNFMPVVWVDQSVPLIIGREYLGYAKVQADIAPVAHEEGNLEFDLTERGATLLSGSVRGLTPLAPDRLAGVRRAAAEVTVLGWKYIPGFDGPDADYPTRIALSFDWTVAHTGAGSISFGSPTWEQAPVGSRIIAALAALPVVGYRRALVASGSGSIDRSAAGRLDATRVGVPADAH